MCSWRETWFQWVYQSVDMDQRIQVSSKWPVQYNLMKEALGRIVQVTRFVAPFFNMVNMSIDAGWAVFSWFAWTNHFNFLKELKLGILRTLFHHVQNHLKIEGKLEKIVYEDNKTSTNRYWIVNHKGRRMVKDGEDWHRQLTNDKREKYLLYSFWRCTNYDKASLITVWNELEVSVVVIEYTSWVISVQPKLPPHLTVFYVFVH